jgi:hypothetical protein
LGRRQSRCSPDLGPHPLDLLPYACSPTSPPSSRLPEDEIEEKLTAYRAELTAKFAAQAAAAGAAGTKDRCVSGVASSGWSCWLAGSTDVTVRLPGSSHRAGPRCPHRLALPSHHPLMHPSSCHSALLHSTLQI